MSRIVCVAVVLSSTLFVFPVMPSLAIGAAGTIANPDFTRGGRIPKGATHAWNLEPTGARGWIFSDRLVTTDARQIAITQVDARSPADGIRLEGLRLLAKHRIREGIEACVTYTRTQNPWASEKRTPELMELLLSYGAHARSIIPQLNRIADDFEDREPNLPRRLSLDKAKVVRDTIHAIETTSERPELIRLDQSLAPNGM